MGYANLPDALPKIYDIDGRLPFEHWRQAVASELNGGFWTCLFSGLAEFERHDMSDRVEGRNESVEAVCARYMRQQTAVAHYIAALKDYATTHHWDPVLVQSGLGLVNGWHAVSASDRQRVFAHRFTWQYTSMDKAVRSIAAMLSAKCLASPEAMDALLRFIDADEATRRMRLDAVWAEWNGNERPRLLDDIDGCMSRAMDIYALAVGGSHYGVNINLARTLDLMLRIPIMACSALIASIKRIGPPDDPQLERASGTLVRMHTMRRNVLAIAKADDVHRDEVARWVAGSGVDLTLYKDVPEAIL